MSIVSKILEANKLEYEQSLLRQKQILLMQAESKQLPDFLELVGIGLLLGRDPDAFVKFIKSQSVSIETRGKEEGMTREEFKRYRQSVGLWPVKDCPLANWWPEEPENICIQTETNKAPAYQDVGYISKDLGILLEASKQFWSTADPDDKTTHPANDEVEEWLRKQGLKDQPSKVGASIIRPEWAARGRRSKK